MSIKIAVKYTVSVLLTIIRNEIYDLKIQGLLIALPTNDNGYNANGFDLKDDENIPLKGNYDVFDWNILTKLKITLSAQYFLFAYPIFIKWVW
jgi:hypothetical protein